VINVAFPIRADARGRTALADDQAHIRDLIEQVLFTAPGERVNRPMFGSGLMQLVFDPNRQEVASATQMLVQSSLQQWLGELIQVEDATVEGDSARLVVTIVYRVVRTQERRVERFAETRP
jgi:phage baseplate assembly protein W